MTRTRGRRGQPGQAADLLLTCLSLSMWARHSSRSLSPGTTTVPNGTAGGQSSCQQPAALPPHRPALRGPGAPRRPQPRSPLTGLFELLLVIVQGLVVVHADPAHLDPQLLRHWLLAAGGATTQHSARALLGFPSPPGTEPHAPPSCLGGLRASFPDGKTEAGEGHTRCAGGRRSAAWPSAPWWPGCAGRCGCMRLRACRAHHPPALGWP